MAHSLRDESTDLHIPLPPSTSLAGLPQLFNRILDFGCSPRTDRSSPADASLPCESYTPDRTPASMMLSTNPPQVVKPQDVQLHWTPQPNSSFLRLPGEIRNRVYEELARNSGWSFTSEECPVRKLNDSIAFLRTCRQIYAETRYLPYALGVVNIMDWQCLLSWLRCRTTPQLAAITEVNWPGRLGVSSGDVWSDHIVFNWVDDVLPATAREIWPLLPNLRTVILRIFLEDDFMPLLDPAILRNGGRWRHRAKKIVDSLVGQIGLAPSMRVRHMWKISDEVRRKLEHDQKMAAAEQKHWEEVESKI